MSENNSLTIIATLALIIGLLGGFWGFSATQETTTSSDCPSEQEVMQDYVDELRNEGVIRPGPETIDQAHGKITEIKEDSIVVKTLVHSFDILQKRIKPSLTVKITEDTEIIKERKKIERSDLAKGQKVTVYSYQDFEGETQLEAKGISVRPER